MSYTPMFYCDNCCHTTYQASKRCPKCGDKDFELLTLDSANIYSSDATSLQDPKIVKRDYNTANKPESLRDYEHKTKGATHKPKPRSLLGWL